MNGKVKEKIIIASGLDKEKTEKEALNSKKVKQLLEGKAVVKVIVVPKKLVNIVVK